MMPRLPAAIVIVLAAGGWARAQDRKLPDLAAVAKKYDLEIITAAPRFPVQMKTGEIDGAEAARADIETYSAIFAFEWSLYPPELVKKTGLKRIVFCKHLSFAKQRRTAVPDFEHEVLYLDVSRGRTDEPYVRKVIHHEFFHIIDLRDDNHLYEDERWSKLNPRGFKYGPGGVHLQHDPTVTETGKDEPGFLNRYAASGVEEDKAEVFAHLMAEPKAMKERAVKDRYMRAKIARMKELLAAFCPQADEEFWKVVEAAERPAPNGTNKR
jgi:hypothetical protein